MPILIHGPHPVRQGGKQACQTRRPERHRQPSLAKLMGDPTAMIIGWKETAKITGLDAPQRIDINLQASIEVQQQAIRGLSTNELLKRLGAGDIIDAEFYDVG